MSFFHVPMSIFPWSVLPLVPEGKLLQPRISWCWCVILSDAPTSATTNNDTARCQRHTPKASVAPWSCGQCRGGPWWWGKTFLRAGGWAVDRRLGSSWPTWFGIAREMRKMEAKKWKEFWLAKCFFHAIQFLHVSSCFCRHLKTYLKFGCCDGLHCLSPNVTNKWHKKWEEVIF